MPEMGGEEVAEAILNINPKAAILFATGHDREGKLASEADEQVQLITKPFSVPELSKMIRDKLKG